MSRAFVKEDLEIPERITRRRSIAGLPPGTMNLMTAKGAQDIQTQLVELVHKGMESSVITHLQQVLESVTVVDPQARPGQVLFGSTVTLRNTSGDEVNYRITGVDELELEANNVSWVSSLGRALLDARLGQKLYLPGNDKTLWTVIQVN